MRESAHYIVTTQRTLSKFQVDYDKESMSASIEKYERLVHVLLLNRSQ